MKVYIDTLNGHRAGELIATALRLGFLASGTDVVYDIRQATHAIFYATLVNNDKAIHSLNYVATTKLPTLLLHDDLDIPSEQQGMKTVSAFTDMHFMQCMYFSPIYTHRMLCSTKEYKFVYGGTYKAHREDMYKRNIPNDPSTLLIGDDSRWDAIAPKATRLGTIRDMYVLYTIMSKCESTYTACDARELAVGNKMPLRAIEPYMCGMTDVAPISEVDAINTIKKLKDMLNEY